MQYVKIVAASHAEALKKLRDTHGPEAIIFSETEVPARTFVAKAMGKTQFMIEAAIREKKPAAKDMKSKLHDLESLLDRQNASSELKRTTQKLESKLNAEKLVRDKVQKEVPRQPSFEKEKSDFFEVLKKADLYAEQKLAEKAEQHEKKQPSLQTSPGRKHDDKGDYESFASLQSDIAFIKSQLLASEKEIKKPGEKEFASLFDHLRGQDFSDSFCAEFTRQLKAMMPQNEWKLEKRIFVKARELLMSKIITNSHLGSKRAVALVGPTGVGKTTTVAKLAAWLKLKEGREVSLITLDNFRIAATEQLKVFGDIMDIPVHICRNGEEFSEQLSNDPADIILVDTTGLSQKNRSMLLNAREYFEGSESLVEKHLVISATSKPGDAAEIFDQFDLLGIDKLILSKIDETSSLGAFVELAEKWHKPFSFFTNGQKVPDDYSEADKKYLAEKILEDWLDDAPVAENGQNKSVFGNFDPKGDQKRKIFVKNLENYDDNR